MLINFGHDIARTERHHADLDRMPTATSQVRHPQKFNIVIARDLQDRGHILQIANAIHSHPALLDTAASAGEI